MSEHNLDMKIVLGTSVVGQIRSVEVKINSRHMSDILKTINTLFANIETHNANFKLEDESKDEENNG